MCSVNSGYWFVVASLFMAGVCIGLLLMDAFVWALRRYKEWVNAGLLDALPINGADNKDDMMSNMDAKQLDQMEADLDDLSMAIDDARQAINKARESKNERRQNI